MKKLLLIAGLLLAASPVAAQSVQQPLGAGGQINNSQLPNTGVICIQEMTATFCNVHRPEHGWLRIARWYGIEQRHRIEQRVWIERWCGWCWPHRIVTPPCSAFPPPNELCN